MLVRVRHRVIVIVGTAASLHVQLQSGCICRSMHKSWLCWALPLPICVICLPILKYSFTLIVNGLAGLEPPDPTQPRTRLQLLQRSQSRSPCRPATEPGLTGTQIATTAPKALQKYTLTHTHTHMVYTQHTLQTAHSHTHTLIIT